MTQSDQLQQDLRFVRRAVEQHGRRRYASPRGILWLWAAYVLVGYTWLDFNPRGGGLFLLIAGVVCGFLSGLIGKAAAAKAGERDAEEGRIQFLHWITIFIGIAAVLTLAAINPILRSNVGGQMIVIVVGIVYFLYGVHRDPHFLWLGVLLIAGAIGISFVPAYPWTSLGVVIAVGLVIPTLLPRRRDVQVDEQPTAAGGDVEPKA
jgi:hypothetical protein